MKLEKSNWTRELWISDNLPVMRGMNSETVDLIYLDPPFNSKRMYEGNLSPEMGKQSFSDIWGDSDITEDDRRILKTEYPNCAALIDVLAVSHGKSWKSYLSFMGIRLMEMHRLLKETGSIYLHCDWHMNSPLRLLMDMIFGGGNLRGEITWQRSTSTQRGSQHKSKIWGNNQDAIFCYTKSDKTLLNPKRELTPDETRQKFDKVDKKTGERYYDDSAHIWRTPGMGARPNLCYEWRGFTNPHSSGWRLCKERMEEEYQKGNIVIVADGKLERRMYLKNYEGYNFGSMWTDIPNASGKERTGWATQKPLALLERIVKASSNKGDIVLDPFCGCGTACIAATRLERQWIGIDQHPAVDKIMQKRIQDDTKLAPEWDSVKTIDVQTAADLPKRTDVQSFIKNAQTKRMLYETQKGKCASGDLCQNGTEKQNINFLDFDRKMPGKRGGGYVWGNVQLLCRTCNGKKGKKTWKVFLDSLRRAKAAELLEGIESPE